MKKSCGSELQRVLALILFFAAGLAGCSRQPDLPGPTVGLTDLLQDLPSPGDWEVAEGPVEYDSHSLWEYLNGGAPLYESYGFVRLVHARYQPTGDPDSSITIDLFEMESQLGAFGLYTSIRPPGADVEAWGAEGFRSGGVAGAWNGRVFVHAAADRDEPGLVETMGHLTVAAVARASGSEEPPPLVGALPDGGLVARSERYLAEDLFGHAFLPGGMIATYELDGRRGQLYFSELASDEAAVSGLAQLQSHLERWGEVAGEVDLIGDRDFDYIDPGLGAGTAAATGRFVIGAHGEFAPEERYRLLIELVDGLNQIP